MAGVAWGAVWGCDRPSGPLSLNAYLDAPKPQPTYIDKLDQLLGGGMTRGLTIVGGPPSSGKSVLACLAAMHMCAAGRRVVYASYEMGWDVVQLRCASAWSCYPSMRADGVQPFNWGNVVNGSEKAARRQYDGLDRAALGSYTVGSHMDPVTYALEKWDEGPGRNLAVLTGGYGVHELCEMTRSVEGERPVLIVDYLQIVPSVNKEDTSAQEQSEYQRVTEVVNALQELAYGEDGPNNVLALSSTRNLSASDYKDGPSLSWYRGSGYVGYAAEQAVMLMPERRKDEETGQWVPSVAPNGWSEGRMTVVKNKSGASGRSIATLMAGWCNLIQ